MVVLCILLILFNFIPIGGWIWGNGKTPRACEESLRTPSCSFPRLQPLFSQKPPVAMASESPRIDNSTSQTGASQQDENSAKRKAEQANGTHTRTKRNRYISIAWYVSRY